MNIQVRENQAQLLKVLSHPTRLAVLEILREGEQCVCHMEAMLGVRQASLSQQLMVLRDAGLVRVRRDGLNVYYRVVEPRLFEILDAVNAAAGKPRLRVRHKHGPDECPCPKCNRGRPVSAARARRIKVHA
ncbi:MAG TPA: metalloregulator ArsR/SmtB family transcription factor [Anaerolineales bacterium]|nr:metalloregulator ArsR/SmtB family transcription factor [Anaerolineales bacterium]